MDELELERPDSEPEFRRSSDDEAVAYTADATQRYRLALLHHRAAAAEQGDLVEAARANALLAELDGPSERFRTYWCAIGGPILLLLGIGYGGLRLPGAATIATVLVVTGAVMFARVGRISLPALVDLVRGRTRGDDDGDS